MGTYRWLITILAFAFAWSATPSWGGSPEDSVVRVFASLRLPNPARPWSKQNPVDVMGTGVVIEGKRILTNAHVVYYASEVKVQGRQGGDRIQAKVETIQQRMSFRESDLRGSITNPNKPADSAKPADAPKPDANNAKPSDGKPAAAGTPPVAPPIPPAPSASTDPDEPPKDAVADYQLLRALDLIRGISLYSNRAN